MKKLVKVEEVEAEGLIGLMGQRVTLFCMNYFYTGELIGVNDTCVLLTNAGIVYETGSFSDSAWKDYQAMPNDCLMKISASHNSLDEAYISLKIMRDITEYMQATHNLMIHGTP